MTNEQMRVELPELPRPDKIEQDMDVNLGRVEYRYFCEDATTAYATAAILADRERRLHAENEALRKERDEMLLLLADPPSSRSK